jgi:DNA-directed RNA polymerase specialized sigma24 family protein
MRLHSFPDTSWTQVQLAGGNSGGVRGEALEALLRNYYPALLSHLVVVRRLSEADAKDVLQGFVVGHILEKDLIGQARRNMGSRFRSFLLTALDRYLIDQMRRAGRKKRCADEQVQLDEGLDLEAETPDTSELFDVVWARALVREACRRVCEECTAKGCPKRRQVFEQRLLLPMIDGCAAVPYGELVDRLEISSPAEAANLLTTVKRMFVRHLRDLIAEYTPEPGDIDEELRQLRVTLGKGRDLLGPTPCAGMSAGLDESA